MRTLIVAAGLAVAALTLVPASLAAQLRTPDDWRWVTETPARVVTEQAVPEGAWRFVEMPPGYHVTTGPGVILYHPGARAQGRYSVEAEVHLFPGESQSEYGVFVGGRGLEGAGSSYTGFVVRRDGSVAVIERQGGEVKIKFPWTRHEAVVTPGSNGMAHNVLRVEISGDQAVFRVNGEQVASVVDPSAEQSGAFGLRVGPGVNLHVTRLDHVVHYAPPRPPR